jgi:NADH-quinone oxidoreductase subunit C
VAAREVSAVDAAAIHEALSARFGDAVLAFEPSPRDARDSAVRVQPARIVEVLTHLRDELRCDFLQNLTAVDWPKADAIELVYHLFSYPHRHEIVIKTRVPRGQPRLPSASALWGNADWLEREQYDLFGVVFEGHPDLRRLLMPDDWVGHPMRKDYREAAEYRGMPTTRLSPFEMLKGYDQAHDAKKKGAGPS